MSDNLVLMAFGANLIADELCVCRNFSGVPPLGGILLRRDDADAQETDPKTAR